MVKTTIKVTEMLDFLPFHYLVADFHCRATPANCLHRFGEPTPARKRRP
jgi:hypothetical protein